MLQVVVVVSLLLHYFGTHPVSIPTLQSQNKRDGWTMVMVMSGNNNSSSNSSSNNMKQDEERCTIITSLHPEKEEDTTKCTIQFVPANIVVSVL